MAALPALALITATAFVVSEIVVNPIVGNSSWPLLLLNLALAYLFIRGLTVLVQNSLDKSTDYHFSLLGITTRIIAATAIAALIVIGPFDMLLQSIEKSSAEPLVDFIVYQQFSTPQILIISLVIALITWLISSLLLYLYCGRQPIARGNQTTVISHVQSIHNGQSSQNGQLETISQHNNYEHRIGK